MSHLIIIQLLATLLLGYTPVTCDACGELTPPDAMAQCETCGAHVCRICADSYAYTVGGSKCFACDDDAPCGQLPEGYDMEASGCADIAQELTDALAELLN